MSTPPSADRIEEVAFGFMASKVLFSAIEFGLFSELAKGPLDADALKARLGLHPRSAADFLDALVALGMLERLDECYSNTPESDFYVDRGKPTYIGNFFEMWDARDYPFWVSLSEALKTGKPQNDPADAMVMMGPLISPAQRARVERYVEEGKSAGAEVIAGGQRPPSLKKGYFYEPTIFTGVRNSMTIAQDEIFGPVGVVIPFDTDEQAIAITNDSRYGLSGAVWSADAGTAFEIALRLRTGSVAINGGGGGIEPRAPFGGYKRSGIGREWGEEGLDEYTEVKSVSFHAG